VELVLLIHLVLLVAPQLLQVQPQQQVAQAEEKEMVMLEQQEALQTMAAEAQVKQVEITLAALVALAKLNLNTGYRRKNAYICSN
jgi:hypothetical protein